MNSIRKDPVKYKTYLLKERNRWKIRKALRKPCSDREARTQRKKWRNYKRMRREQSRSNTTAENLSTINDADVSCTTLNASFDLGHSSQPFTSMPLYQKIQGRKRVRRDRSKVYQENYCLKVKLCKERQRSDKYCKRAERLKQQKQLLKTPRNKTSKMIGKNKVPLEVWKSLLFSNVIS